MPTRVRSRLRAFAIVGVVFGILAGFGLGLAVMDFDVKSEIHDLSLRYITRADEINDEVAATFAQIHESRLAPCSDEDLVFLRALTVNSRFLKSAARLEGRHMLCNALLGRLDTPIELPLPDIVSSTGLGARLNSELQNLPGARGLIIEQWEASVVIGTKSYDSMADPRLDYSLVVDAVGGRYVLNSSTPPPAMPTEPLVNGEPISINGLRYEVVCSDRNMGCIIARFKPGRYGAEMDTLISFVLMGGITGGALGFGLAATRARRWSLANRLQVALRAGEVTLVYQPIVRLVDREITGLEALARWHPAEGDNVPPDLFVAAAEQGGFVVELTHYVIRRALAEMASTLRQRPELSIAVNIAAEDLLLPSFNDFIADVCNFHRVSRRCLSFEITERSTIERQKLDTGIRRLRAAGHRIYIDDFGVQYSNLSYLVDLNIDAVKLDRSFTMSVGTGGKGEIIAAQIAGMVAGLNMDMVVEGIETTEQASYFATLPGTILGQGWLFGKPVEPAEIIARLEMPTTLVAAPTEG